MGLLVDALACCDWGIPTEQAIAVAQDGFDSLFRSEDAAFQMLSWKAVRKCFSAAIRHKLKHRRRLSPLDVKEVLRKTVHIFTSYGGNLKERLALALFEDMLP